MTTTVHCADLRIGDEIAGRTIVELAKGSRIIGIKFDDGTDVGFDRDDLGATLEVSNRWTTPHFHQPRPGTVTDVTGAKCPAATAASYPLNAYCACGAYLSCASGDADWADADPYDVAPTPDRPLPILQGLMDDMLRGGR